MRILDMDYYGNVLCVHSDYEGLVHVDSFFHALCVHLNRVPSMRHRSRQRHLLLMTLIHGVFDHPELECVADFLSCNPEKLELRPHCYRSCEALRVLILKYHASAPDVFPVSAQQAVQSVPSAVKRAVYTFVLDNLYQGIVTCFTTFAALVGMRYHFNVHIFRDMTSTSTIVPWTHETDEEWNRYALYILHKDSGFYLLTPVYVLRTDCVAARLMQHVFELRLTQKKSCTRIAYFTPPARKGLLVHVCDLNALDLSVAQRACIFSVTSNDFKIQLQDPEAVLYIFCARKDTQIATCVSIYQANNIHVPRFYLNAPQKDSMLMLVITTRGQDQANLSIEREFNYRVK